MGIMHDHHPPRPARQTARSEEACPRSPAMAPSYSRSLPSRQHSEESWIDISSRPSSSSLSSAADEIITTGLTVQHDSNLHRRHRRARGGFQIGTGHRVASAGGGNSSQEEYDESESESDRVMTSSNEHIGLSPLRHEVPRGPYSVASSDTMSEREEEEDDDENATAVNYPRSTPRPTSRQFQPRPNAFSHPSAEQVVRSQSGTIYTPRRPSARLGSQRQHSYPQHTPYNVISPNHQADHDEALRASLSTLLSAAAAVRGLPKPGQPRASPAATSSRVDPSSLRMVPESVALGEITEEVSNGSSSRATSSSPSDKSKRKASPAVASVRSSSRDRHAAKKARKQSAVVEEISPTLFTWVVSAGVVVLVSALSFSAGYVVGNEAGYAEAMGQMGAVGSEAGSCGKEAVRGTGLGLRRLRWTGGAVVRV
ncbi:uncharacterized protein M421DRAFT_289986 [Didymella exigua CBS 183.55]|uniref:REJ domain-containing protein n=1 Tax=Didymella exigua CBS 183.55 TaxID=1150837 RepID=A0A6A5RXP0_9PLEO|nr:uncharacterized protein M421DRAFT_289986 [Didymella exigua CBS 183.55]KAF1932353.1 hypothetical protein M421DRAFT_289986 [Didymella exigua CBS 183.55]